MDIAQLQLTIDGQPALAVIGSIDAALKKLPGTATTVATQVNSAFAKLNAQTAIAQSGQLMSVLGQLSGQMNQLIISTNSLNLAVGSLNFSKTTQGASSANSSLVNVASGAYLANLAFRALREGADFGKELIDTRIEFDRFDLGMKAVYRSSLLARDGEKFLNEETDRLGLQVEETMPQFVKISAAMSQAGFTAKQSEVLFTDIATATRALGLSSATTGRILYDFQEMASLGTVQMRQLRQVIMQVPGGLEIAARAMGVTTEEFHKMVTAGKVAATDFIPKFADELKNTYGGAMNEAANNMESSVNRMSNAWLRFKASLTEGSNGEEIKNFLNVWASIITPDTDAANAQQIHERATSMVDKLSYDSSFGIRSLDRESAARQLNRKYPGVGNPVKADDLGDTYYGQVESIEKIITLKEKLQAITERSNQSQKAVEQAGPTDKEIAAQEKLLELMQRVNIERLTGLEKQNALIDLNTRKQLEEYIKLSEATGGTGTSIYDVINMASIVSAGDKEKQYNDDKAAMDQKKKDDEYYTSSYTALMRIRQESAESTGSVEENQIARINAAYDKQLQELTVLYVEGFATSKDFLDIEASRAALLDKLHEKTSRRYIDETNLLDIQQRRLELEKELYAAMLKPDNDRQVSEIQAQLSGAQRKEQTALATNSASPSDSLQFGIREAQNGFGTLDQRIADAGASFTNNFADKVSQGLTAMADGTRKPLKAFEEMSLGIVSSLEQVIIKEIFVKTLLAAMNSGGGGNGTLSDTAGTSAGRVEMTTANAHHRGGMVGYGNSVSINSGLFSGAPRFHTGGIVGDEMPIIAKRGEVVFTPEQMKALGDVIGGANKGQKGNTFVNAVDPHYISDFLAANPDAILNVIGAKSKQVSQMLQNA